MKMKKKLYGILAFVLVALCALGFAFGFAACSKDDDDDGTDPLIGTWQGNVDFTASMGQVITMPSAADTTIIVDENSFSLSVKNVEILGSKMFTDEDYVAIEDATWVRNSEGDYTATADITGSVIDIPIVVGKENGTYYISLTADIELSIAGFTASITASFDDARVYKVSDETTKPWTTDDNESEGESESMCECGEDCTCGEDCECGETCECENCGTTSTSEEGCTCGDDCTCDENCECGEDCTCEDCTQSDDE